MFDEKDIPGLIGAIEGLFEIVKLTKETPNVVGESNYVVGASPTGVTLGVSINPILDGKHALGFGSSNLIGVDLDPLYDVGDVGYDLACSKLDKIMSKYPNLTYNYLPNEEPSYYRLFPLLSVRMPVPEDMVITESLIKEIWAIYEECITTLLKANRPLYS